MAEWFENELFWEEMYPYMFSEERLKTSNIEVEKIFERLNFQGDHVLDLCCGPGRHAVLIAQKGCQVTAVDKTPFLLNKGREKAVESGVDVEWVQEDMRNFVRPNLIQRQIIAPFRKTRFPIYTAFRRDAWCKI